jgi:CheY-like chemotaxis protein
VNQEVCVAMLRKLGCQTVVAANGKLGVEAALGSRFDLVLMDCHMPEMDGYAATQAIRASEDKVNAALRASGRAERRTPIIALTANAMEGDRERCLSAGMDDYLTKPFKKDQLREVLVRWSRANAHDAATASAPE